MTGQERKIKISELPASLTFQGLWTIGYQYVDGVKTTVRVSLGEIQTAYEQTLSATYAANQAASLATTATERASAAALSAEQVTETANQAELSRQAAEESRISAETTRETAESTREENETERQDREATRYANESARQLAEEARSAAEAERKSNEEARQSQESQRSDAESARQASETTRDENEQARMEAEGERISHEADRETSEAARNEAEETRKSNEATRLSNETARQETESTRVATEIEREANELTRKSNESTRQAQEAERQTHTATAIANAETATNAANTAAQNAIKAKEETEAATELANELNNHPWIIQGGVWYKWNTETDQYVSTGLQAKGDTGASFTIVGIYPTVDDLKAAVPDGTDVDGVYAVGTGDPYDYYAWVYQNDAWQWVNQGQLRGPEGKSAYEVWLGQGNEGKSYADYIYYLQQPAADAAALANQAAEAANQSKEAADQAEALRAEAETAREQAESSRQAAESSREQAESDRGEAEDLRHTNEDKRMEAELTRKANEKARTSAETARQTAEDNRTTAEAARATAENNRSESENLRAESEITRQQAETARIANESNREASETERQTNELQRQSDTATAISDANQATSAANEAAAKANAAANKALSAAAMISVPDIDHEPTEEDLTYLVNGETRSFVIGGMARYYNPDKEDYYFYQLYDITAEGKAYWKISGSGTGGGSISVVITSNQGNDANIASAKARFSLLSAEGGDDLGDGDTIDLSGALTMLVSCEDIEGYNTPSAQTVTVTDESQTLYFEYTCEKIIVTADAPEGEDISGLLVTVKDDQGKVWKEEAYGTGFTCNVPFGTVYTVTMQRLTGYKKQWHTHTAAMDQREINITFDAIDESYLLIDTKDFTTGRMSLLEPAKLNELLSRVRGCMMKPTESGAAICYLSDTNNNKYATGEVAVSGDEGDLMTYLPDVYYLYENIGNGQVRYAITDYRPNDEYHHIPACLIGQVKATEIDGVLRSVAGYTPVSGKSYNELITMAKARGEGFGLIDWEAHCLLGMLLYAKYQTTDLQAAIGASHAYYDQDNTTGTTCLLGSTDSQPAVTDEWGNVTTAANYTTYNRALNIEGIFGGLYEYMQGCKWLDGTWYVTDRDGTERAVATHYVYTGWIRAMALEDGPRFDMLPTRTDNGSSSTFYADYCEMVSGEYIATNAARGCFSDKQSGDFPDDGISYLNATNTGNIQSELYGTRLAYYGQITVVDSVTDYLAL